VPDVAFALARTLVDLKQYGEAEPLLERLLADRSQATHAVEARYLLGWTRLQGGRTEEGLADLRAFVEANPTHELARPARRQIAEALLEQGDDRAMMEEYRTLLSEAPPTPEGLHEAWSIAGRLNRAPEREAAARQLQQKFPQHLLTHRVILELANAAFKDEKFDRTASLARAIAQSPDDRMRAQGFLLIGETELRRQRYPAALAAFTTALASGDGELRARARAGSARIYEEQRKWAEALALYRDIAGDSADPALRQWAAERAAAIPAERRRLDQRAALDQARTDFSRKGWDDAVKQARAAAQSPESAVRAEGLVLMGEAELKRKRYAAALKAFDAAAAVPDIEPSLQFRALAGSGVVQEARRQWSKAIEHYEKVAAESPDADLARWAAARTKAVRAYQTSPGKKPPTKPASRRIVRR
jgi:tetratricopeptide (TPR) repeat protein